MDLSQLDNNFTYPTLGFIEQLAKQLNTGMPYVTFEKPLWLKADEIIKVLSMNIFCRLGGFHMSSLGSIVSLMAYSGLSDISEIS